VAAPDDPSAALLLHRVRDRADRRPADRRNARKDRAKALEKYRAALSLGGSRPLPELFRAAGIKFGLDAKILKPLIQAVESET
jgi:hypothetical protein